MTVGVGVFVPVGLAVGVGGCVPVVVGVAVAVGGVVGVRVGVCVGVPVAVWVAVPVAVDVTVGVGVAVGPTKMLPLFGVHGTGVSKIPGTIASAQLLTCSWLFPFAWPWKVMFTMLIGGAPVTGVGHANEQITCPMGGVGAGVLQTGGRLQPVNGATPTAFVARTTVESYWIVKS